MRRIGLVVLSLFLSATLSHAAGKPKPTPATYPRDAEDVRIYREYEVCMNGAKKVVADNKLEGQSIAGNCLMQLQKYGKDRASRAFNFYFENP